MMKIFAVLFLAGAFLVGVVGPAAAAANEALTFTCEIETHLVSGASQSSGSPTVAIVFLSCAQTIENALDAGFKFKATYFGGTKSNQNNNAYYVFTKGGGGPNP
jgi:uncharacterized protein YggE